MAFHFGFKKRKKISEFIGEYIEAKMKERRAFEKELEKLDVWLRDNIIDHETYQRMKDVLEVAFVRQREKALASLQDTFLNTLSF